MGINYMEGERHVDSSDACDVVHVHLICNQPDGRDPQNLVWQRRGTIRSYILMRVYAIADT